MAKFLDLTGRQFGRLIVLRARRIQTGPRKGRYEWRCKCVSGRHCWVASICLTQGHTQSCGCYGKEVKWETHLKHGHAGSSFFKEPTSPTYRSWQGMHARCCNPRNAAYKNYGARGITVCKRWQTFEAFLKDMGERPKGTTLGRINHAENYKRANCAWQTMEEQTAVRHGDLLHRWLNRRVKP
jgi:hypothetical protein